MEQEYQFETEVKKPKKENTLKKILNWIVSNFKFLLIPFSRYEELTKKEFEYEKTISQRLFIRRLKSPLTIIGILIILSVVTIAVFGHWLSPYPYETFIGKVYPGGYDPPSPEHPLGTTKLGYDVLSIVIFGASASLTIALPSIIFSVVMGVIVGIIAAYYGGLIDSIIMRIIDIMMAFPSLILAMVFIQIWGQKMEYIMLAYGILGIPFYARLIRGSVLQAKSLPYVDSAKVAGAGNFRVMFRHILPNVIQPIIISFTFDIGGIILSLAGLNFLGFHDPGLIEWGFYINVGSGRISTAPWASFWPGFMIIITVLGFMLLGDGLRDALDPRLKNL
ncbi:MAG: ABC transporter permease [Promethearchaeota archaeon]|nr:MAG: ABC transporter permease [Candidatus Lokiarchaeota archaeon]